MRILRRLRKDFQEFPATMVLGTLWVLVFASMVAMQASEAGGLTLSRLLLGLRDGHRFGDLTVRELYAGQVWRTVTATFVHYGLVHIGLNLWAFYQLGCLTESWYGAGPFVAIYVVTGGLGNLLSGVCRHLSRSSPLVASGGGSVVVMGLVALCAVVGWRARTRVGDHLRDQMLWVLGLTALLGLGLDASGYHVIDNWGHAGGAVVGGVLGVANDRPGSGGRRRLRRVAGWAGALALAACAAAQAAEDRREAPLRLLAARQAAQAEEARRRSAEEARSRWVACERLLARLEEVRSAYRVATDSHSVGRGALVPELPRRPAAAAEVDATRSPADPPVRPDPAEEFYLTVVTAAGRLLASLAPELDRGDNSADFREALGLLSRSLSEPPTREEARVFDGRIASIRARVRRERDSARLRAVSAPEG
jgi:rhomboid protease GluP